MSQKYMLDINIRYTKFEFTSRAVGMAEAGFAHLQKKILGPGKWVDGVSIGELQDCRGWWRLLQLFLVDIELELPSKPILIKADNQKAIALAEDPRFHSRANHIEIQ